MLQETIYDNRELSWLKFNKRATTVKTAANTVKSYSICITENTPKTMITSAVCV